MTVTAQKRNLKFYIIVMLVFVFIATILFFKKSTNEEKIHTLDKDELFIEHDNKLKSSENFYDLKMAMNSLHNRYLALKQQSELNADEEEELFILEMLLGVEIEINDDELVFAVNNYFDKIKDDVNSSYLKYYMIITLQLNDISTQKLNRYILDFVTKYIEYKDDFGKLLISNSRRETFIKNIAKTKMVLHFLILKCDYTVGNHYLFYIDDDIVESKYRENKKNEVFLSLDVFDLIKIVNKYRIDEAHNKYHVEAETYLNGMAKNRILNHAIHMLYLLEALEEKYDIESDVREYHKSWLKSYLPYNRKKINKIQIKK